MAVLFDPADDYVCSVLEVARVHSEISLADLEAICEAGIEARDSVSTDDIVDTIDELANMGIEVDNSLPPEEQARRDAAFLKSMRERPGPMPQLTGNGWAMLLRAIDREKAAESETASGKFVQSDPGGNVAPAENAPVKRTFMQEMFAGIGPRVRRTRSRIR
jgi:hypothetical protein